MSIFPWQGGQWQQVSAQHADKVLPHAYLFNGPKGVGKLAFANLFAAWLLCEDKAQDRACGICKQCKLVEAGTHSDLKLVQPEDGSSVIKVDAIRALSEFISKSSQQGGLKVVVLEPAESLNINASNALLKTLEEPAPNSLIILVSHASGQLLPTIRSRCQVIDFAKPSAEQAAEWLGVDMNDSVSNELLSLAGGAPLEVQRLREMDATAEHEKMLQELGGVLKRDVSVAQIADRWADDFAATRLTWMIMWLQQIVKAKVADVEHNPSAKKMFDYVGGKASEEKVFALYDECLKQAALMSGTSNPNKNLLFEHLFAGWLDLIRK